MNKARYIRQSTKNQTNLRQLAKSHPDETLYIDIISGSVPFAERPEGKKLIEAVEVRTDDTVYLVKVSTKLASRMEKFEEEDDLDAVIEPIIPVVGLDVEDDDDSEDEENLEDDLLKDKDN